MQVELSCCLVDFEKPDAIQLVYAHLIMLKAGASAHARNKLHAELLHFWLRYTTENELAKSF